MSPPLFWSDAMDELYSACVSRPVADHPRTEFGYNELMGYPFSIVREEVIAKGLADFSKGHTHPEYGSLTAGEKALLYSFINFKKHFYACRQTYDTYRTELQSWLTSAATPVAVDIGCGPGTAGLALCDTFPGANWDYVGIDVAPAMLQLAAKMFARARLLALYGPTGNTEWRASWSDYVEDSIRSTAPLLVVCSYLFANSSLNTSVLLGLADWLRTVCRAERPVALLVYLNSTNPYANTNYEYFKTLVGLDPQAHQPVRSEVQFHKKKNDIPTGDTFLHELLILKGAT
jgi:SAM-dependent methyltransferase